MSCKILMTHRKDRAVAKLPLACKREGVEYNVCSIVHNVISHDVTSKIHTRKSQSFLFDIGGSGLSSEEAAAWTMYSEC